MIPRLKAEDVCSIISNCQVIGKEMRGGQKIVFPCEINKGRSANKTVRII